MPLAVRRPSLRPAALLPLLVLLSGLFLTGCVRSTLVMAVSEDDRVSGELVVQTVSTKEGDLGPVLKVPADLASRVRVSPLSEGIPGGYVGSQLFFNGLTFAELRDLSVGTQALTTRYQFGLRRAGSLVTLSGSVDLTQLAPERTDVKIKISFPGRINSTNGREIAGGISWTPKAGQVTELAATVAYSDSTGESWERWAFRLGIGTGVVALFVALLALLAHRRHNKAINA